MTSTNLGFSCRSPHSEHLVSWLPESYRANRAMRDSKWWGLHNNCLQTDSLCSPLRLSSFDGSKPGPFQKDRHLFGIFDVGSGAVEGHRFWPFTASMSEISGFYLGRTSYLE